jgi:hypothetical protein
VDLVHHEVAYLGRHVNWTLHEVLELDHAQRRRWVAEAAGQREAASQRETE